MAIGNYYPISKTVTDSDLFLGTQAGHNNTVNYTAQSIADYLNTNSKVSIAGQLSFQFTILQDIPKTISFPLGGGNNTPFSNITTLIVSSTDVSNSNITIFLDYLEGKEILLAQQNQPNSFGHYSITSYAVTANPNFYTLDLSFIGGNGVIIKDLYYDLISFNLSSDKTFIFTQNTASTVWNIQHNLNKFPSVSVVNINNILMYGEVTYIDTNNLTITFSAGFSGKAYMN
jgi:hypothetical protein